MSYEMTEDRSKSGHDSIGDRVETIRGTVGDTIAGAQSRIGDAASSAKQTLSTVAANVPSTDDVQAGAQRGLRIVQENPLGLVLGALALGAIAGLLLPVTDYERKTIGPIRDELVDRAGAIGADALQHGRAVLNETAQTAVQTAQQSVRTQGTQVLNGELTPDALKSSVVAAGKAILHDTVAATIATAQQSAATHGQQVVAEAQGQPHTV